jgi:exonuclease III
MSRTEEDFLFMSRALKEKLHTCEVVEGITSLDHAPLKATLNL